ncbi:polynucleotide kinase-phosphatase [Nesterenkonia muleiensis]|uniref:polynucleotide kinase-phosphatase n=1 Tax=Nesterenkonia muleiensis TaxID=2282648 RepID=UPI000E74A224|nr:polynucleotide kinase-phosphatase [Nesterenkonia muleiensis]
MTELRLPARGLILLVGVSGSGKSTFAAQHFAPTEVISSDWCRGIVSDDQTDQSATPDAYDVLQYIVDTRLRRGLLTVVDATNVQPSARAALIEVGREHDVLIDAVVLEVPDSVAVQRNLERADRNLGPGTVKRQAQDLRRSLKRIKKEGFRRVHLLNGPEEIDAARIVREQPWNDRTELTGPFDLIGDVHGCACELSSLLLKLGWELEYDDAGRAVGAAHPQRRTAVFVGDLVDRGPDTPGVLRLVMGMVSSGSALCVAGNHEAKLVRALRGKRVTVNHGLAESLEQLEAEDERFRRDALEFMDGLISHYVLDEGRLVVAHAGLKEKYHGRTSRRVRDFALNGETTGQKDQDGLPVRGAWQTDYRGGATVVYGHTPVTAAEWVNNTMCLDTGAVFGGELSSLRYPEQQIVSVPAQRQWYPPPRPIGPVAGGRAGSALKITDVIGQRWLQTEHAGKVKIPEQNAAAALEVMSRYAVDPRWLVYLPPTMSPVPATAVGEHLERPEQAFEDYASWGVQRVVCQEKHMGSRAIAVIAKDAAAAQRRFGIDDGFAGMIYTRTGRQFFEDVTPLVEGLRDAVAPLLESLESDWLMLDCELLPWSAKAEELIKHQYAAVGAAAGAALPAAVSLLDQAAARGFGAGPLHDLGQLRDAVAQRLQNAWAFRDAYARYCAPADGLTGVTLAPFQVLASEGEVHTLTKSNAWHMEQLAQLDHPLITATRHRYVDLASPAEWEAAAQWWADLTVSGGEGMVVKPADVAQRRVQPGLKVRGREYLRIIYGPDYTDSLDLLRRRKLGKKRQMAQREHGLGIQALADFIGGEPLWKVHQSVFAILALESDPVDPRL